ncbi:MAG TPA: hypothetical protein VLB27_00910 [candidate division Zixibacteria bacterium]|nr:hypothetical protein [candidate division Zixibacteria bacterium]
MTRYAISVLMLCAATTWSCGEPSNRDSSSQVQALGGADDHSDDDHCERAEADAQASKPHKITICHIPPGNPDNAHTINVSKNAKRAHLAHGDVLGGCGCSDDGGGDDGPTPGSNNTPGGGGDTPVVTTTPEGDGDGDGDMPSGGSGDPGDGSGGGDADAKEPQPTDSTPPSDGAGGTSQLCDSDQTICDSLADCGDNQTCDATSGCCVDVYL